jgi:hypothetical protein
MSALLPFEALRAEALMRQTALMILQAEVMLRMEADCVSLNVSPDCVQLMSALRLNEMVMPAVVML